MVSTRGNPLSDSGRKDSLPSREARKRSARGALQEPEDELFWDSDDQFSRVHRSTRNVNVTFKDATSPRSASSRSPGSANDVSGLVFYNKSSGVAKTLETDSSEEVESEEEAVARTLSRKRQDEVSGVEGDTDTDDDYFQRSQSRRTRGQRNKVQKGHKKAAYMINGDDLESGLVEDELGVRRSLRRRKYKEFDQSWLVGNKKLKGYPTMVPSSEPENDEPRPARKLRRHMSSDAVMVSRSRSSRFHSAEVPSKRRSRRVYSGDDDEEIVPRPRRVGRPKRICSPKSDHSDEEMTITRNRTRLPPRRYRELDNSDDEEESRMKTRFNFRRSANKEQEKCKNFNEIKKEPTSALKESSRRGRIGKGLNKKGKSVLKSKVKIEVPTRRVRTRSSSDVKDENEDSEEDEEEEEEEEEEEDEEEAEEGEAEEEEKEDSDDEGEEEEGEGDEGEEGEGEKDEDEEEVLVPKKKRITRRRSDLDLIGRPFVDLYSSVKRERRPVKRFMYEDEVQERRSRRKRESSSGDSDDKEDEDDDDDDDDDDQGEDSRIGSRYSLRQNRRERRPFQVDVSEKKSRARDFSEDSPHRRERDCRNHKRYVNSPARKHLFHRKKRRAAHNTTSSDSSSDESHFEKRKSRTMAKARNRCLPMNMTNEDLALSSFKERAKIGSSLADVDPMALDRNVTFESVGGLTRHLRSLKEMIIFPLLYPEVFERFSITPPRGVLFHGPPGTGKTLVARALANECGTQNKKVAFFMRKGADCLSKWVGESERQLRLLFDQAYQMRPSIIFFDEIDGLAPVRSSRQDQIHSSIVSTLLALMDGLDSRGEVVVIGATNRIDAIDPALRRPGRFDREFHFPLPSYKGRQHILKIHTRKWEPLPSKKLLHHLAQQTVGYCGADIKSLCAEATLVALKSKFPQIYTSKQKLLIDVSQICVKLCHFRVAMSKIVAAGQRSAAAVGRKLSSSVQPLLQSSLDTSLRILKQSFPHAFARPFNLKDCAAHRPRLMLTGLRAQGQSTHLGPSIVHSLEKVPTHKLDLSVLYSVSALSPEEACAQVFHEARRNFPSIVYVPHIDQWWGTTSDTVRATFMSLLYDMDPATPLLLLATSDIPYDELDEDVQMLFSVYHEEVLAMTNPTEDERRQFFKPLFYTSITQKPKVRIVRRQMEPLPLAPSPQHHSFNSKEMKRLEELEEATLRELRIFLREICAKLAKNKTFYIFTKPVDEEEVPDYRQIIKEPMDLETMMTKIDQHLYECAQEFLNDVDLICNNALEYNPDRTPEDKIIRHRACTLRDTAYAYIKAEMDTDFEYKCRDIKDSRKSRYSEKVNVSAPNFIHVLPAENDDGTPGNKKHNSGCSSEPVTPFCNSMDIKAQRSKSDGYKRKKRRSRWARGEIKQPSKKKKSIDKEEEKKDDDCNEGREESDDGKKHSEDCDRSEDDMSVHSTDNSEVVSHSRRSSEAAPAHSNNQVSMESEVALFNGHLSTEDSHDSMRVTSAVDELAAKASLRNTTKDLMEGIREDLDDRSLDTTVETEDSVVSSSEQGGGSTEKNGLLIDWNHLQAVYESCISATDGAMVEDLQRLYTSISSLIKKHITSINRTHLLQEIEAEMRRFTQFHKKS